MPPAKETTIRTFTKTLRDGTVLTRPVTDAPSSEVEAVFDGFREKPSTSKSTPSKPANSSS